MPMKKFINKPEDLVKELLEGYALAFPQKVKLAGSNLVVRARPKAAGKVGVVTLGGSGHEPALSGFVGEGMLDISVAGEIFAAPGPPRVLEALKMADRGAGVLFIVLNHAGDVMSAKVVMEMVKKQGVVVKMILTHEDIAGGPRDKPENRRGLVGCVPLMKVAGAAAEAGKSLDQCLAVAERMSANMATLAVAMSPATHPSTGQALFTLADDEMEIGLGQHGEPGTGSMKIKTADATADAMLGRLLADLQVKKGEQLLVMLNGAGATTLMELFIVYRRVAQVLKEKGIVLAAGAVDEFLTVQEMAGFQMCIVRMDKELLGLWNAPCDTPYLTVR
ncbi:MAG: dihydroxyacetone kinase subunit DhaK [Planctomycetota bacterium]|nr:dihydroxyacetone kinase subunit DhaK [Planctomycetota bacterium]